MEYRLIRSKRKSLALTLDADGTPLVRAPLRLPLSRIDAFVQSHAAWIETARVRYAQEAAGREQMRSSGMLPLLGQPCPVREGTRRGFRDGVFYVRPEKDRNAELEAILRALAKKELSARVAAYAPLVGVTPGSIGITGAKGRFGSCSGEGNLHFSFRLIHAAPELIDAVVVHELCHILQHNHSARFWQEVERVLPDSRERERKLKEFGRGNFLLLP